METTEGFQVFHSETSTFNVEVGYSVTAKLGIEMKGFLNAGAEVTVASKAEWSQAFTSSTTRASERKWSRSESETTEVSRQRTITVPPYTVVLAYDAVKRVENVQIPFTQVLRVKAKSKDGGRALSGAEIRSQLVFNFMGGVIVSVGEDYADVSVRGHVRVGRLFNTTSNVIENPQGC